MIMMSCSSIDVERLFSSGLECVFMTQVVLQRKLRFVSHFSSKVRVKTFKISQISIFGPIR